MFWDILTPVEVYLKISANGAPSAQILNFSFRRSVALNWRLPVSSFEAK
jgi:hypothetical protein